MKASGSSAGAHGVRLVREAEIHDLDLVAIRGSQIQHLAPREQIHGSPVLQHELGHIPANLTTADGDPLDTSHVDLRREVAHVRKHCAVTERRHDLGGERVRSPGDRDQGVGELDCAVEVTRIPSKAPRNPHAILPGAAC